MQHRRRQMYVCFGFIVIAIVVRLIYAVSTPMYFDGSGYIYQAQALAKGGLSIIYWFKGPSTANVFYPPIYPLLILICNQVIASPMVCGKVMAILAGGFMLLPAFLVTRRMFGFEVALYATAVLVAHPILVIIGSNVFCEPAFIVLMLFAFYFFIRLIEEPKLKWSLLTGIFTGLTYLAKSNGIILLPCIFLSLLLVAVYAERPRRIKYLVHFMIIVACYLSLTLWYDYYSFKQDSIFMFRSRQEFFKKGFQRGRDLEWYILERTLNKQATDFLNIAEAKQGSQGNYILNHPKEYWRWVQLDFHRTKKIVFEKHYVFTPILYIGVGLLLIGLAVKQYDLPRRKLLAIIMIWAFLIAIIVPLTATVSEYYFSPVPVFLAMLAANGFKTLRIIFDKISLSSFSLEGVTIHLIAVVLLVGQPGSVLKDYYEGLERPGITEDYLEVADWLKSQIKDDGPRIIMSSSPTYSLYSGNYWYLLPADNMGRISRYAHQQGADYLLADSNYLRWLKLPDPEVEAYFMKYSVPGLQYVGTKKVDRKTQDGNFENNYVLFKVEDSSRNESSPAADLLFMYVNLGPRADKGLDRTQAVIEAPPIRNIFNKGALLNKVITPSTDDAASYMSVITSTYPLVHEVRDGSTSPLAGEFKPMGETLRTRGYQTALFTDRDKDEIGLGFDRGFESISSDLKVSDPASISSISEWLGGAKQGRPVFLSIDLSLDRQTPPARSEENSPPADPSTSLVNLIQTVSAAMEQQAGRTGRPFLLVLGLSGRPDSLGQDETKPEENLPDFNTKWLFYGPQLIKQGRVIEGQASGIDILPTIYDFMGIDDLGQLQGISLKAPMVENKPFFYSALMDDSFAGRLLLRNKQWSYYCTGGLDACQVWFNWPLEEDHSRSVILSDLDPAITDDMKIPLQYLEKALGKEVVSYRYYNERYRDVQCGREDDLRRLKVK